MNTELTNAAQQALEPCPFCGCEIRLESNSSWHRLQGDHKENCPFEGRDETLMSPATDEQKALLYRDWNTRAQRPAAQDTQQATPASGEPYAWLIEAAKGKLSDFEHDALTRLLHDYRFVRNEWLESEKLRRAEKQAHKQATPEPDDDDDLLGIIAEIRDTVNRLAPGVAEDHLMQAVGGPSEVPAYVEAVVKALTAPPEPVGEPVGTWRVNGRMLYSDDFSHDAALKLTGDFESDEQRDKFAANVCAALNATRPAAAPAAIREHLEGVARRSCTDEQFNAFKWIIDTTFESLDLLAAAPAVPEVDDLAQFIRQIDGKHSMGAGALAEHICEWIAAAQAKGGV